MPGREPPIPRSELRKEMMRVAEHVHEWDHLPVAIAERYACSGLPVISLMRAYTNDVFRVSDGGREFALKLYAVGWRTDAAIAYELDLL